MAVSLTETLHRSGLINLAIDQDAVQADDLVADPGDGVRIIVVEIYGTLDAAGTLQVKSDTTNLSGVLDIPLAGGIGLRGTVEQPLWECPASTKLNIVTTGGKFSGSIKYKRAAA